MKQFTKQELEGKFVVAYDTVCDGNQCMMEGEEGDADYAPLLFNSADEAFTEIFDANLEMLKAHESDEQLEEYNEGVTPELIREMELVYNIGNVDTMREFMKEHPECDDNGEWVSPAEQFIMGRKAFFTEQGVVIEGKKLSEI